MNLEINLAHTLITVSSDLLDNFVADPSLFADIVIEGFYNDTETSTSKTYTNADPIDDTTDVATSAGVETIKPSFFSGTSFGNGVYHFIITLTTEVGISVEEGCLFVDTTTDGLACLVNDYRLSTATQEKKILAGLDYFLLMNSQDCNCKCPELIDLYNDLYKKVTTQPCQGC